MRLQLALRLGRGGETEWAVNLPREDVVLWMAMLEIDNDEARAATRRTESREHAAEGADLFGLIEQGLDQGRLGGGRRELL